jgi:RNA polymerase sigma-70 factor (ECF subfamily)
LPDSKIISINNPQLELKHIYESYYNELCLNAYRIVKDKNAAEDVVQEVIIEYWNKTDKDSIQDLKPYLYKSVYFRSLNFIKKSRRHTIDNLDDHQDQKVESSIEHNMEYAETLKTINEHIDELPERCRLVFVLSRFESKTYKEIAEELDISIKTVENQIGYALKYLRNKIKNE